MSGHWSRIWSTDVTGLCNSTTIWSMRVSQLLLKIKYNFGVACWPNFLHSNAEDWSPVIRSIMVVAAKSGLRRKKTFHTGDTGSLIKHRITWQLCIYCDCFLSCSTFIWRSENNCVNNKQKQRNSRKRQIPFSQHCNRLSLVFFANCPQRY